MSSAIPSGGALAILGITPNPVDTVEAVRAAGINPRQVGTCAPNGPGVRGCAMWDECPFHLAKYGGFKGAGPKNVLYYLETAEGEKKEDYIACYGFVRTLLSRMRDGNTRRERGQVGDFLRVIGGEGEEYVSRYFTKVDPTDKREEAAYDEVIDVVVCPKHPRLGDRPALKFDNLMQERETERLANDPSFAIGEEARHASRQRAKIADQGGPDEGADARIRREPVPESEGEATATPRLPRPKAK